MKTIALLGQKGGTGKTTTTIALAVAAAAAGFRTAVFDLDPQTNAANWFRRRPQGSGPEVRSVQAGELPFVIEAMRNAGAQFVFIDTPGRLSSDGLAAARLADLVLIPARAQIFDVETISAAADLLLAAKSPPAAILRTFAHPSAKNAAMALEPIGERFGIPVAPVALCERAAYAEAPAHGQAPQEYDPGGKAAAEIAALFEYVRQLTNSQTQPEKRKAAK